MSNMTELLAAGMVGFLFYSIASRGVHVKNSGLLEQESGSAEQASGAPQAMSVGEEYGPAGDIKGRQVDDVCQVNPPEMLSTSLLPATDAAMDDGDFVGITPQALEKINFLDAGWALGRDTQTNTMRNASYDLRSEPPNPRLLNLENNTFMNTTIDYMKKRSFEPELAKEE
jgi:hypothetical protein